MPGVRSLCLAGTLALAVSVSGGSAAAAEQEVEKSKDVAAADLSDVDSDFFDLTLDELLEIDMENAEPRSLFFYGFVRTNLEKVFHIPSVDSSGDTHFENDPMEWSFPGIHLYGAARPVGFADVLLNLEGDEDGVTVREGYGNIKIDDLFQIRAGRMYRRFGLFNEKLDQFPTFLGIEPPELFDQDHLMLPRTTLFSIHGVKRFGDYSLLYFLDTGNGESGAERDVYPLGWDLRLKSKSFVVGTSGFLSSLADGSTSSTRAVLEGSPRGGVLPWMSGDEYVAFGFFGEYTWQRLLLQVAYWQANHDAERDPANTVTVGNEAGINSRQASRFFGANANCVATATCVAGDVDVSVDYKVRTVYVRAGYTVPTSLGSFTPYLFLDWMDHPEVIQNKTYGGDNEAGLADNGKFWKPSVGVVYKPTDQIAIKLDSSAHIQKFNGETEVYPEVRLDISFAFKMLQI